METVVRNSYCSMWQLHGLSSVIKARINVLYPDIVTGSVRKHLNRLVVPREPKTGKNH